MLTLKDGCVITGNKYTNKILETVQFVYFRHGWNVVITSGDDGEHSEHSYHAQHRALDVRFWDIPPEERRAVAQEIRTLLPSYYDVVLESDHYHIEADAFKEAAVKG
jgi:hypothetical protein